MANINEVEVILVGNELLKGERRDAHLAFIGHQLLEIGVRVEGVIVVGDDRVGIADMVRERLSNCRVLIVSGGLGPTHDDITREGVADGLGLPLEFHDVEWKVVQEIFKTFGKAADESNRRQAYFPKGATPMPNPVGTAAGFIIEHSGCLVAVLPGPPRELIPMFNDLVVPRIKSIFKRPKLIRETFRTTGIGESAMTPLVQPIFEKYAEFVVSSLPHLGGVDIVIGRWVKNQVGERGVDVRHRAFDGPQPGNPVIGRAIIRAQAAGAGIGQRQGCVDDFPEIEVGDDDVGNRHAGITLVISRSAVQVGSGRCGNRFGQWRQREKIDIARRGQSIGHIV